MKKSDKILFLDIDDTLLISDNIYIYVETNGVRKKITTHEYSNLTLTNLNAKVDYSEFDDPYKIKNSIINGKPIYKNLKIIDKYIENGWELGILTARGEEKTIKEIIGNWLSKHLTNEFKLNLENIYAVGDRIIKYDGKNSSERKINILRTYTTIYGRVCLIDDSQKTIEYIKNVNKKENLNIEYILVE